MDWRTCRGQLLGSRTLNISAGTDLTIVITKNAPKVVVFDNASPYFLGEIPPRGAEDPVARLSFGHAAEIPVNWTHRPDDSNGDFPWSPVPSAPAIWTKGDVGGTSGGWLTDWFFNERVTKPGETTALASRTIYSKASRRYEFIFIGTNAVNAKMVVIDRGISLPSA